MGSGVFFFFSSRRRHTRCGRDWSSDVCSSDLRAAWLARPEARTMGSARGRMTKYCGRGNDAACPEVSTDGTTAGRAGLAECTEAWPPRRRDIMRRIWHAFILVTVAIAAIWPAAAAAASGHPARAMARPVTAHIRVKATIPVGRKPFGVAADPRTNTIYVTNLFRRMVSVISGRTNTVAATIGVGRFPVGVATDP